MPVMSAACRTATRYPTPVCSEQACERCGVVEGLPFYISKPGVLGSSLFLLPLWCPVKGCAGDVAWLSSHLMSDPSQSSLHDDRAYAVLVAASEEMLVGENICRFLVWKGTVCCGHFQSSSGILNRT